MHKARSTDHPNKIKNTARNKIGRIEKEIARIEPLASARKAVDLLQTRLEYWKKLL